HAASLTVQGSPNGNGFSIPSSAAGMTTTISAGAGDDTFNISSPSSSLDDLAGPITIDGEAGTNPVPFSDAGATASEFFAVYSNLVTRALSSAPSAPTMSVGYANFATVTLYSGSGNEGYTDVAVEGSSPGTTISVTSTGGPDYHQFFV